MPDTKWLEELKAYWEGAESLTRRLSAAACPYDAPCAPRHLWRAWHEGRRDLSELLSDGPEPALVAVVAEGDLRRIVCFSAEDVEAMVFAVKREITDAPLADWCEGNLICDLGWQHDNADVMPSESEYADLRPREVTAVVGESVKTVEVSPLELLLISREKKLPADDALLVTWAADHIRFETDEVRENPDEEPPSSDSEFFERIVSEADAGAAAGSPSLARDMRAVAASLEPAGHEERRPAEEEGAARERGSGERGRRMT